MVGSTSFVQSHGSVVLAYAFAAPLVVAATLHVAGSSFTPTTAALVLVLVVVAAAATGLRSAGIVAALSAGAWFDYFLTRPYESFKVTDPDDLQAAVLLLLVGIAVSELALWGRRQQARASRRAGYLSGVLGAADLVALRAPELVEGVCRQIVEVLGVDACRFEPGTGRGSTTLAHDGSVVQHGQEVDVARHGLPTDDVIALGAGHGRFLLTASTRVVRPTIEQRRVAVLLADQVRAALAADRAVSP
jgi:K+-sensing histidine kinase KdpD